MIIVLSACVQKTGEYGSIYLELPLSKAEYEAAAVPEDTTGFDILITGVGFDFVFQGDYKPGKRVIIRVPAGELLVDVAAYRTTLTGRRQYLAANSIIVHVAPNTTADAVIELIEVSRKSSAMLSESMIIGTIHKSETDKTKAVLTISSVEGYSNLVNLVEKTEFTLYEKCGNRSDAVPRPFSIEPASFVSDKIDISFVIDNSGSMGTEIRGVKDSVTAFVEDLQNSDFDLRVSAVGYTDYTFRLKDFTDDIEEFVGFINQMPARGNWEFAYDAIMMALDFDWRPDAQKTVILITDENADLWKATYEEVIDRMLSMNVVCHLIYDPRDCDNILGLADETGGLKMVLPPNGYIELDKLPIGEFVKQSFSVVYSIGSTGYIHSITLVLDSEDLWFNRKARFEAYY